MHCNGHFIGASWKEHGIWNRAREAAGFVLRERDIENAIVQCLALNTKESVCALKSELIDDAVKDKLYQRMEKLSQLEALIGCTFDCISAEPEIITARNNETENSIDVEVYLVTSIKYHYEGIPDSADHMLYGVNHNLHLEKRDNSWRIMSDSFDERDITGIASDDIIDRQTAEFFESRESDTSSLSQQVQGNRSTFSYTTLSVNAAIQYAVTYCGFSETNRRNNCTVGLSSSTQGTNYYNSQFGYHSADCANFVSQCLFAAGMPTDSTWHYDYWNANWVGAWELVQYLTQTTGNGYSELVSSSYNNVYPGNPVYWGTDSGEGSYHIMLCVGYNSAGVPVICGHTSDMYRWPISGFMSAHNVRTIKMATSNLHTNHTQYAGCYSPLGTHYSVCVYCEKQMNSITYQNVGDYSQHLCTCSGCGTNNYESHDWVLVLLPASLSSSTEGTNAIPAYQCRKCGMINPTMQ